MEYRDVRKLWQAGVVVDLFSVLGVKTVLQLDGLACTLVARLG
jgi:hypothetical protein